MKRVINFFNFDLTWVKRSMAVLAFVVIALTSGLVFIHNIGSFAGPDMLNAHYRASLALATGQSFTEPTKKDFAQINYTKGMERYFLSGVTCENSAVVSAVIGSPLSSDGLYDCDKVADDLLSNQKEATVSSIIQYPQVNYIPQALALRTGMSTGMDPADAQDLARFFNLIIYVALIASAIKLIPKGKWLMVVLGLLPSSLFLASSLSCDGLNIAWSFLVVSYVARLYVQRTQMTKKQMAILAALGFGLFILKVAYSPLALLMLALPKNTASIRAKLVLFFSVFVAGSLAYLIWSSNWGSLNAIVDTSSNLSAIVHNIPKVFLAVLLNVLYTPMTIFSGSTNLQVGAPLVILVFIVSSLRGKNLRKVERLFDFIYSYRLILLAILAACVSLALTYSALLLTWTDLTKYSFVEIQGFQGRYVLPLLPMLTLIYYLPFERSDRKRGGII